MSGIIGDYSELKSAIGRYLIRSNPELVAEIPTFIALAERRIFRRLRIPANEALAQWDTVITESIALPQDYLEMKLVYSNDRQLTRISEQRLFFLKLNRGTGQGETEHFCRIGPDLFLYRVPDDVDGIQVNAIYWKDYSGLLVDDTDTNPILTLAPDLYLFGSLLQAEPYLKNDKRMATWNAMYQGTLDDLHAQRDAAEYSGSNVTVANAMGGDL